MLKKFFSVLLVVAVLCSAVTLSVPASALLDTSILLGDANRDNKVDTTDVNIVLKAVAGLSDITDSVALDRADVNNDGYITIYDARQILRSCAGLSILKIEGPFKGFEGNGVFGSAVDAVSYFNKALNRVKTEMPGFIRSEESAVTNFNINNVTFSGVALGETASSISQAIKEMIVTESEPEAVQQSLKGTNCDNAMSAETETYVSKLSEGEALGVKVTRDNSVGTITVKIALPDCELDNLSQTAYADVFNTRILKENTDTVLQKVFGETALKDAVRKSIKNCTLTAIFDSETANVVSYVTEYEADIYLQSATIGMNGGLLSAQLNGVSYTTKVSVTYDTFQW